MSNQIAMRLIRSCATVAFVIASNMSLSAVDVKIIANPGVKADTISRSELKNVFLLQSRTLRDGSAVTPVLEKAGQAHEAFLRQYLDLGSEEIRTYYQGLVFTGKGSMPKALNSEAEIIAYVARTKGAIGYVSTESGTEGVKVLQVTSERVKGERSLLTRVDPDYPETLQRLHIGGIVRLQIVVSPKGTVVGVSVLGGNPILAEAAARAVKQWVYAPAPSQTRLEVTIPFEPRP